MKKVIIISEKDRNNLERLDNEIFARKSLISYMIENNLNIENNKQFNKYQKDYTTYTMKFNQAKREIEEKYILPIKLNGKWNWYLNYKTCELTINYEENN